MQANHCRDYWAVDKLYQILSTWTKKEKEEPSLLLDKEERRKDRKKEKPRRNEAGMQEREMK